jgi:flagellar biosynthesis repressor protein FlbT
MLPTINLTDLPLEPNSIVFVNGVCIARAADGTLKVDVGARVLSKDDLMSDVGDANTPTRRIYFVLQSMLLDPANRDVYRNQLIDLLCDRSEVTTMPTVLQSLATLSRLASVGEVQDAMEICQKLIEFDDAISRDYPSKS